ncbi:MAG: cation transporting ATPase C-terminal domain-containing protein, partial [Candidatus Aenigmarchaeota archaeon]|nr:cation transporting ATPase C-terminal domain-containing protein [Candidatus Aenigmarchaeota archaeon]
RSLKKSIFRIGFLSNKHSFAAFLISVAFLFVVIYIPFFQEIFQFVSLGLTEVLIMILLSSSVLWAGELYKFFKPRLV